MRKNCKGVILSYRVDVTNTDSMRTEVSFGSAKVSTGISESFGKPCRSEYVPRINDRASAPIQSIMGRVFPHGLYDQVMRSGLPN